MLEKPNLLCLSNNSGVIDMEVDGFVHEEKLLSKMVGLSSYLELDWGH